MTKVLEGKTALVTGASRNLGRGVAERLAASGALVAINYANNAEAANATLAAIEAKGGQAFLLRQELGPPGSIEALVAALDAELTKRTGSSGLDILVNNLGGSGGFYETINTTTPEIFDYLLSLNVRTPFFLTQALLPRLRENGRIINMSSAASRLAGQDFIVYSMCKAAVDMFTRVLAKDLGPRRITVNAVLPGFNETESNTRATTDPVARKQVEDMTALGRFGKPRDIADVVHALASPEMGWVTSQLIEASGGFKL
jgi:NAD(P)-dependent dehydrogenase (short-subunit alcohol dehydrogenase family)